MNAEIPGRSPPELLLTALSAYEKWVSELEGPGSLGSDTRIGQAELQKVLDIRREAFPLLNQETTELLLAHARIVDLVYESQLRAIRAATRGPSVDLEGFAGLVQRQRAAIEKLRSAVGAPHIGPFSAATAASGRVN